MKAILRIGFLAVATLCMAAPNAFAIQASFSLIEESGRGDVRIVDRQLQSPSERVDGNLGEYEFGGSVVPARVGLIGASTGFRAVVSRVVDGFSSVAGGGGGGLGGGGDDGELSDADTGVGGPGGFGGPGDFPSTEWTRIQIDTQAVGLFSTDAEVRGLDGNNDVGFLRFDWVVTGVSSLFLDAGDGPPFGSVTVNRAASAAILSVTSDQTIPDGFIHSPTPGTNGAISDVRPASVGVESFLIAYDSSQLSGEENPLVEVGFEFAVSTSLDITNDDDLGNFEALFNADFSNTATLTNVTVLQSDGLTPIVGASVVDAVSGQSIVASTVPEPSAGILLLLGACSGFIRRHRSCVA